MSSLLLASLSQEDDVGTRASRYRPSSLTRSTALAPWLPTLHGRVRNASAAVAAAAARRRRPGLTGVNGSSSLLRQKLSRLPKGGAAGPPPAPAVRSAAAALRPRQPG